MNQPQGFIKKGEEDKVCLLKKFIYGLKQSHRNLKFDSFMKKEKFVRNRRDHCVYMKNVQTDRAIYLLLYVDDMLIASRNKAEIKEIKDSLNREFEMKDLGKTSHILGIDIIRDRDKVTIILSQESYVKKVLKAFGMIDAKPVTTHIASHFKLRSLSED